MLEVEAKFMVSEAGVLEEIAGLEWVGPLPVISRRDIEQVDEYWDTPARGVAMQQGSLRVRRKGSEVLFTAKTPVERNGMRMREEVEEPAQDRALDAWVASLQQEGRYALRVNPAELAPVLTIRNRRRLLDLETPEGIRLELAVDQVQHRGPRGEGAEMEIEIELIGTEPTEVALAALHSVSQWLAARFSLAPSTAGKYARALRAVG